MESGLESTAVLLSAGLDSAVLAAVEARRGFVHPIYVKTGLAWENGELAALDRLLAAPLFAERIGPLVRLAFTVEDLYPETHWARTGDPPAFDTPDTDVYLPGRNIILLSKAAIYCARQKISRIALGPLAGNPFPDATPRFFSTIATALSLGLDSMLRIDTPFANMNKGEVIALVGASGAGKSTLVDLIPRFSEPTAGRILLDGVDTREIALPALRSLIGIVSQDTVLFNDTVRNNLAYGSAGKYSQEQIEAAARAANAHRFIAELPQGYDTVLGERGTRLSGGQRQRLAIARALLVDPPILILDEATSALDTESERLVQEAIDRLLEGRTVFVIAHRLSTIAHADQILVLDRGRVVEHGTHGALLARRGHYHRLHALQFAGADELQARARNAESPVPSP